MTKSPCIERGRGGPACFHHVARLHVIRVIHEKIETRDRGRDIPFFYSLLLYGFVALPPRSPSCFLSA